ncbi:dTMP kinase [Brevibacterium samyangense]|uniref:Thymidylate kinase n=1 Tax=Brevibacterium samyangense TaxID=366888 RepID=A0ABN2T5I1_9MICO
MSTATHAPRAVRPPMFGPLAVEAAAWSVLFAAAASAFAFAGYAGPLTVVAPGDLLAIGAAVDAGEFSLRTASVSLLVVLVFAALGMFLPNRMLGDRRPEFRQKLLAGGAAAAGAGAIVLFFVPVAWLAWLVSAFIGVVATLVLLLFPGMFRKPWRSAGASAAVMLFVTYVFQIAMGVPGGAVAVHWLSLVSGIVMVLAAVLVFLRPSGPVVPDPTTSSFPKARQVRLSREPALIERPWACYALFGVLGTVLALAQPTVADHDFGQAGFAVLLCAALLGWAVGYEIGPTFAPGMSRPRLTAFALLGAGVLTIALGIIDELSGKAVLTGAVAALAGLGVRAQPYVFSRRVGIVGGAALALLLTLIDRAVVVPLSEYTSWVLTATGIAYCTLGALAVIAGVLAHLWFVPQGLQGITVDIVHAFRQPGTPSHSAGPAGSADPDPTAPEAPAGTPAPAPGQGVDPAEAPAGALARAAAARVAPTGFFIAFEGGDGAGKTTQIRKIAEHLESLGIAAPIVTREPGGTEAGVRIREVVLGGEGVGPRSEALLFAADRAHHVSALIEPALEQGRVVLTDRYIDSSLAYQAAGRELSAEEVANLSRWATTGLVPHLTVVLDVAPETGAARTASRGEENHLDAEGLEFRQRVRAAYLDLAAREPSRYVVVDANRDADAVAVDIRAVVEAELARVHVAAAGDTAVGNTAAGGAAGIVEDRGREGNDEPGRNDVPSAPSEEAATTVLPTSLDSAPADSGPTDESASTGERASGDGPTPADEAATTVLPAQRGSQSEQSADDEAETTVLPPVRGGAGGSGTSEPGIRTPGSRTPEPESARAVPEDAETTVLPPARPGRSAHGTEGGAEQGAFPGDDAGHGEPSGAPVEEGTTGPERQGASAAYSPRERSRERLQAQAAIEREARERLRQSRLRPSGREGRRDDGQGTGDGGRR